MYLRSHVRFLFILLFSSSLLFAQQTGKVDYPALGLSFSIPEGWQGQESEGSYLIGHNSIPGFVLLLPHDQKYTVDQLLTEAQQGLQDNAGTSLMPAGAISKLDEHSVGGEFSGMFQFSPAKAYIIGMSNTKGNGITIMAVASTEVYQSDTYKNLALQVKESVSFSAPQATVQGSPGGGQDDWKYQLGGTKLTWMESYSSGGQYGGGYNMKTEIHLCKAGYFRYNDNSFISAGTDVSSAYSGSNSAGDGSWDIQMNGSIASLVLQFHDGSQKTFQLEWRNGSQLFMDGYRYYRTWEGENAT